MKRRLFTTILPALSLLLFVAVVGLWVRSGRYLDQIVYNHPLHNSHNGEVTRVNCFVLASHDGVLRLSLFHFPPNCPPGWSFESDAHRWLHSPLLATGADSPIHKRLGFSYSFSTDAGLSHRDWTLPIALPGLLTLVLPVRRIEQGIRSRKARRDLSRCCCGYDLRATPGRCPECGRVPAAVPLA